MSSTSTAEEKACDKNGRIRTENWEYAHKVDLTDIIREHVNVIDNKKTDAGINRKKNDAWSKVYSAFCTKHGNKRNLKQLKNQWKNIKANAKKSYANYEKEKAKTIGGPPPEPPDLNLLTLPMEGMKRSRWWWTALYTQQNLCLSAVNIGRITAISNSAPLRICCAQISSCKNRK